jgi:hypothetical protein
MKKLLCWRSSVLWHGMASPSSSFMLHAACAVLTLRTGSRIAELS